MTVDSNELSDVDKALKTEWLVTNGLGGYASSSVLGVNTRKYHGLLVAAFNPPVDRRVLLTKLDEEVIVNGATYPLGSNEYEWGIQPQGYRYLSNFSLNPPPTYTYELERKFRLQKTVLMLHGKNVTIVIYEASNTSKNGVLIYVSPLVNSRHFHTVTERNVPWKFTQKAFDKGMSVQPTTALSTLILFSTEGSYRTGPGEWTLTYFRVDASRGESSLDNNFKPGFFEFDVPPNQTKEFSIIAVAGKSEDEAQSLLSSIYKDSMSLKAHCNAELKRQSGLLNNFHSRYSDVQLEDWLKWLVLATDAFIVNRESTKAKSVIAGYHWFEDWGRDALVALPGLTLVTGRFDDARQILLTFQKYCREGIVPNRFPDIAGDKPAYNTVDATLWYFNAVLQYLKYTGDFEFVQKALWNTLESITEDHVMGTVFLIHMDQDGLIAHGPQLTWMDAAVAGKPITPREGKAVEIQALWYNALKTMQLLATYFGKIEKAQEYLSMAERARKSFVDKFWNPEKNCLFDVVNDELRDTSVRPNQIMAVSLDFTMLDNGKTSQIVETVQKRLWGVYGLKTLSDDAPLYKGRYQGDWTQRDKAYHNGTVWPWLLGSFVRSFLRLRNHEIEWRSFAFKNFLQPLFHEEIFRAGLGTVSEIFDGDSPHEPNGCIAQAWSVAEPLRAYIEDVLLKRPPCEQKVLGP